MKWLARGEDSTWRADDFGIIAGGFRPRAQENVG